MHRPIIGIIGNRYDLEDGYPMHAAGTMNSTAVVEVCDCMPMIVPSDPNFVTVAELMDLCHGFIFTGARPNVHPEEYGEVETEAYGAFDRERDALTLPLIRSCIAAGLPILAICRGFQELNVAMGGTLHPEIRDLPGRDNHRMPPDGTTAEKFALRHIVSMSEDGPFHRVLGDREVMTNSLHGQGIKDPGERVVIDGHAPDGTPEAIYVAGAPGFNLGVQWHPEWQAGIDPVSRSLFKAFGSAAYSWRDGKMLHSAKSA